MNIHEWWDSYWPSKVAYSRTLILDNVLFLNAWCWRRATAKDIPAWVKSAYTDGYYAAMQGEPRESLRFDPYNEP